MTADAPYTLHAPEGEVSRAVFSSPHSGADYPPELLARTRLSALQLRGSEDAYVDALFAEAPQFGAPLLAAHAPRAYVDLNRAPEELDPAVIRGARAFGANPRIAAGLGVIPRVVAEGRAIYDGKLSMAEAQARIARHHAPFHARLSELLNRAKTRHGAALLFDCHSMPSDALRSAPRVRGRRPDIVLGDRFGASAAQWVTALTEEAFAEAGFVVARNTPFAGGWIAQRHGRPAQGRHVVQIEINRGLYLDEARVEKGPDFEALRDALRPVVARLASGLSEERALAAQ